MSIEILHLTSSEVVLMESMLATFGEVFQDPETYTANAPSRDYLRRLLGDDRFIAVAAVHSREVLGGLAAYELQKFEQERSEIFIYDLAVAAEHRRRGIATALIGRLHEIAARRGAGTIIVQADTGVEDEPAIALYSKLGRRRNILHFEIPVDPARASE